MSVLARGCGNHPFPMACAEVLRGPCGLAMGRTRRGRKGQENQTAPLGSWQVGGLLGGAGVPP